MPSISLGETFWYAGICAEAVLLARLVQTGLAMRYPTVASYLGFALLRSGALFYLGQSQQRLFGFQGYSLVYVATQPILWAFYFLLILELYSLMVGDFPGIRRLGRLLLFSALAGLTAAGSALMLLDRQGGFDPYPLLAYLVLQERSVFLCLSALILLLLAFVAYYSVPVRRNVWVFCASFGGYFISSALLLTLRWYFGSEFKPIRNLSNALFFFLALLGAVLFFSRAGETETRPIRLFSGMRDRETEAALAVQLQSFNQALVKVLRQ